MSARGYGGNDNWFKEPIHGGGSTLKPTTEAEVVALMQKEGLPPPLRPCGSRHSMTRCISTEKSGGGWGTLVDMSEFTKLGNGQMFELDASGNGDTAVVTVAPGCRFIDIAQALDRIGWMFRVNTELGPLTVGAAACGATKDSAFADQPGQVCHDVVSMRLVRAKDGRLQEIDEAHPDLPALRCSYGLFGIVTEVKFRVFRKSYISLRHELAEPRHGRTFAQGELQEHFDRWLAGGNAVFLYMFPYINRVVAEIRGPAVPGAETREHSTRLAVRNAFWDQLAHDWEAFAREERVPLIGDFLTRRKQDLFGVLLSRYLTRLLTLDAISPVAQIVDFEEDDPDHRFTFSMWAFHEDKFAAILPQYFALCRKWEKKFRTALPHASYHISKDESSLLSYSLESDVWTLDPICPKDVPEWPNFLDEFNQLCSGHNGIPLLNQTPRLTAPLVQKAFGERLTRFKAIRKQYDPEDRMLNDYFAKLGM